MSVKIQGGNKDGTEEVCAVVVPTNHVAKKDIQEIEKIITDEINTIAKSKSSVLICK